MQCQTADAAAQLPGPVHPPSLPVRRPPQPSHRLCHVSRPNSTALTDRRPAPMLTVHVLAEVVRSSLPCSPRQHRAALAAQEPRACPGCTRQPIRHVLASVFVCPLPCSPGQHGAALAAEGPRTCAGCQRQPLLCARRCHEAPAHQDWRGECQRPCLAASWLCMGQSTPVRRGRRPLPLER